MVLRRFFLLLLAGNLVLAQSASVLARELTPDPRHLLSIDSHNYEKPVESLSAEDAAIAKQFLSEPTEYILEILYLLKMLHVKAEAKVNAYGLETVAQQLAQKRDANTVAWEETGVGKAEIVTLGRGERMRFFTKVRHNGAKATFLFVDKNQIDLQSLEDPPDSNLPPDEYKKELEFRRYLLAQWKTLLARMILSEWNPSFEYKGLHAAKQELAEKEERQLSATELAAEREVLNQISSLENLPGKELEKLNWYENLHNHWFNLAMSSEPIMPETETMKETIVVFYNGETNEILDRKVHTPYDYREASWTSKERYSLYLKHLILSWKAMWEPPAYDEKVWQREKGLGKLRVLLTGDYLMSTGFGFTLSSLTYLTSTMLPSSLPMGLTPMGVAGVSLAWSVFFGVFSRTWQNFVYRGSNFSRFCKNWITGLGQSYHYNLLSDVSLNIFGAHGFDLAALKIHTDILINQTIKNYSKTSMQELPRYRKQTGEATGTLHINDYNIVRPSFLQPTTNSAFGFTFKDYKFVLPSETNKAYLEMSATERMAEVDPSTLRLGFLEPVTRDTAIPRANFEGQLVQLISTPISLLSRFGWTMFGVPIGHIIYLALGPIGEFAALKYKIHYYESLKNDKGEVHPLTQKVKLVVDRELTNWEQLKMFGVPYTQPLGYYFKVVPRSIWRSTYRFRNMVARYLANLTYHPAMYIRYQVPKDIHDAVIKTCRAKLVHNSQKTK